MSSRWSRAGRHYCLSRVIVAMGLSLIVARSQDGRALAAEQTAPNYPRINLAVGYRVDPSWPKKPADLEWGHMPGIAADQVGNIWIFTRGSAPVQVYRPDGTLLRSWGKDRFKMTHGMRIDHEGSVWVTDCGLHIVQKYTPEGKLLLTLGTPDEPGEDDKHFNMPTDIAITSAGDVFISDGYRNGRVVHFDKQGRYVKAWGKIGVGPGEFSIAHGIAVDSKGRLYVADRNNVRIQVFDQTGKFLAEWRNLLVPWGITITPQDEIYVCGTSPMQWGDQPMLGLPPKDQILLKLDPSGRVLQLWTFPKGEEGKEQPGELNWLHSITVDPKGNLYLGDIKGKRVQKFVRLEPQ